MDAANLQEKYGTASSPNKVDILHPCVELEWRECGSLPVGMRDAQAVWLGDKLYVGGGWTSGGEDETRLYIHSPTTDTWSHIDTPVYYFALITYHSQLVLVGGRELAGEYDWPVTNKLWTVTEHDPWRETLPPMIIKRHSALAMEFADNILVAGGVDYEGRSVNIVEVYNGHHWAEAQCLPKPCSDMKSTILNCNGHWYLMGGWGQGKEVYYVSLDSLVASCRPSEKPLPSVWKRLPDVPHDHSSTAVFGNRLIAVGGYSSSSIHAYSPHSKYWVHVGDVPIEFYSTCTAVLPTGDLMVIGGWSDTSTESLVLKASLKFNDNMIFADGYFTMETLSQLEHIGIRSLRELEAYKQPLQSVVGMDEGNLPIDNSSSLLEMWVQGRASLRPTWRHFFWALREIKLNHLADQIEASLSGVAVEQAAISEETEGREEDNKQEQETVIEEKHIAAVQKAMEERGMLDHTIVHGVFVGPARSGKNSLMERLLGRMPSSVSPSTGVAESVVQVKVIQKSATFAANVEESIWSEMDEDDEAIKVMLINSESQNEVQIPNLRVDLKDTIEKLNFDSKIRYSETTISNTDPDCRQNELAADSESSDDRYEVQSSFTDDRPAEKSTSFQPCPQLPHSYVSPIEIVINALKKKGKEGLEILQQHFYKTWSLYLTNTGGQMEFQEVLPLLVSGPSMFFFTFRLDRDLDKPYAIEYDLSDGTSAKPYTSTLTTLEGILQTLASVSAMGMFIYRGLQKRTVALRPKVFLVGTHKDKLDNKKVSKRITKVDKQLQEVLESTSHYKDLVEFASPTQLIFTVNNFSESDLDFQNIRSAFERVVVRDEFRMTSPSHWLIFSLALRKLTSDVISYDLCLEVARQCGLADDEVDEALHFIHSKMGLIRYFPYEDVKNFVVIHPQHLFDKVTELIVNTFTFEKAGKQKTDEFNERGIFSLVEFENIYSRSNSDIKAFQFLKLLEKLRIAAPFHLKGNVMYFFPCVLAHVLIRKVSTFLKMSQKWKAAVIPHLLVIFDCGYCPKGLPGALISYLMANEMGTSFTWNLRHDKIFRNQVSFLVGPLDTVVLDIYSTHLMISITIDKSITRTAKCMPYKVCSAVCKAVEAGIKQITSSINYVNANHSLTFHCKCNSDHPAELKFVGCTPHNMYCSKTNKTYPLPKGHELWQISRKVESFHQQQIQSVGSVKSSSVPKPLSFCGYQNDHPGKLELLDGELSCDKTGEQYPLPSGHELWRNESEDTPLQSENSTRSGQAVGDLHSVMPMVSQQSQPAHYPYQSGTPTGQQYIPQTHFTTRGMPTGYAPVVPIHPQQGVMAQPVTAPAHPFSGFPQGGIVVPDFNYPPSLPSIYGASTRYPAFSQDTSSVTGAPSMPQSVSYPDQVQHTTPFEHFSYHQQPPNEPGRLTQYHLGGLVGQLSQHATKWRDIGTHLGFLPGELSNIEASPNLIQGAPVSWLSAMLAQWLQRTSSATLEDLKTALGKAGLAAAAHDLKI